MRKVTISGLARPQAASRAHRAGDRARGDVRHRHADPRRHAQQHVQQPDRHRLPARQLRDPRQGGAQRERRRRRQRHRPTASRSRSRSPPRSAALPGVAFVHGSVEGYAQFLDRNGNAIGGGGGSTLGLLVRPQPAAVAVPAGRGQRAHDRRRRRDGQGDGDQAPLRGRRPGADQPAQPAADVHDHGHRHVRQRRQPRGSDAGRLRPADRADAVQLARLLRHDQRAGRARGRQRQAAAARSPGSCRPASRSSAARPSPTSSRARSTTSCRSSRPRC